MRAVPPAIPRAVHDSGHRPATMALCAVLATAVLIGLPAQAAEKEQVAVLQLENLAKGVTEDEAQFITDAIRQATAEALDLRTWAVMTRQTMEVLLGPTKIVCLAGKCLAEIGRTLQAKYVIGGSVKDVGGKIGITLETYESATAALLGTEVGRAASVDEAISMTQELAKRLVGKVTDSATGRGAPDLAHPSSATPPFPPSAPRKMVGEVAPEIGRLAVEGLPRGARVDILGPKAFGDAGRLETSFPCGPWQVPSGDYAVKVSSPGYDDEERTVTVHADRTALVQVDLEWATGTLEVAGEPKGARVELECAKETREVFGLPGTLTMPRGNCLVRVTRSGYEPFERTVRVAGGKIVRVDLKLTPVADVPASTGPGARPGNSDPDRMGVEGKPADVAARLESWKGAKISLLLKKGGQVRGELLGTDLSTTIPGPSVITFGAGGRDVTPFEDIRQVLRTVR